MKPFKFFSSDKIQYVPIITKDTYTTYRIPIDLYRHMSQLAVDLHRNNMSLFGPVEYRVINEIGENVTYFYKIDNVAPYFDNTTNRIMIEYSIKFPDTEYYCNFITQENLSLYAETL